MGRVLVSASLATLVFTAVMTVHASLIEVRRGRECAVLLGKRLELERQRAGLIDRRAAPSTLRALDARARAADLPLRVPGLPELRLRVPGSFVSFERGGRR